MNIGKYVTSAARTPQSRFSPLADIAAGAPAAAAMLPAGDVPGVFSEGLLVGSDAGVPVALRGSPGGLGEGPICAACRRGADECAPAVSSAVGLGLETCNWSASCASLSCAAGPWLSSALIDEVPRGGPETQRGRRPITP